MMDVIGIGALNWDKLYKVDRLAQGGDEIPIWSVTEGPGGSGANTVCALARLGFKTGFIGKVGGDSEGKSILDDLDREGMDRSGVVLEEKGRSGLIIGIVDPQGERALYVHPGVNDTLTLDDMDIDYINSARYLHMSSFVGDTSYEAQKALMGKIDGPKISFAPGALYARRGMDSLRAILEKAHVLFVNRDEVEELTGTDYQEGAEELVSAGVGIIAVTLGAQGSYVFDGKEGISVPGEMVDVVDTTGAGDAYAAGFLAGLLEGASLEKCAEKGHNIASKCIGSMGARAGLPYK